MAASPEHYPLHGIRSAAHKFQSIEALSKSDKLLNLAQEISGSAPCVVRVIFFDKTPDKNWLVSWHQDKTIVVNEKKYKWLGPMELKR